MRLSVFVKRLMSYPDKGSFFAAGVGWTLLIGLTYFDLWGK